LTGSPSGESASRTTSGRYDYDARPGQKQPAAGIPQGTSHPRAAGHSVGGLAYAGTSRAVSSEAPREPLENLTRVEIVLQLPQPG
jgi:hypothetical protein